MQVHDELAYGVPTEAVEEFKAIALQEMCRRPEWAPDLPLDAEPGVGSSYGEAK
jgi:DNA polymerase I-like protein with 3'-5' exonuclease and polymerase domains